MSGTSFLARDRGVLRRQAVVVSTPPAAEPVSLPVVKQHLRLDSDVDDTLVQFYASTARTMVEAYTGRVLVTQGLTWRVQEIDPRRTEALLGMPTTLVLPRSPVQSVQSVTVRDALGVDAVVDPSIYTLDAVVDPAVLRFVYGQVVGELQHIEVVFTAGYGAAAVAPPMLVQAILVTTTHLYEHRGEADVELPAAAMRLCDLTGRWAF